MNINFKTKDYELDATVREYAQEKMSSLIKFVDGAAEADARFDVECSRNTKHKSGEVYRVDVVVVAGGTDMHAVGHGETMQAALDMARDDLARRLSRTAKKEQNMLRKGSRAIKKMLRWG